MKAAISFLVLILIACGGGPTAPETPKPPATPPDYSGTWTGTYTVTSAGSSGSSYSTSWAFARLDSLGGPVTFVLQQSATLAVTGYFTMGRKQGYVAFVPAQVTTSGVVPARSLRLTGTMWDGEFKVDVVWELDQAQPGIIQAREGAMGITLTYTRDGWDGKCEIQGSIGYVYRQGG